MIRLEPIGPDNWREELEVREDQKRFVSEPNRILARAYAYRDQRAQAKLILDDDTPVGMLMYYDGAIPPHFSSFSPSDVSSII